MTKTMNIRGMMCGHCKGNCQAPLEALEGVITLKVDHEARNCCSGDDSEVDSELEGCRG